VILAPLALLAARSRLAAQPVFRARIDGVRLDVLVTDQGRPLAGLTASDFDVRDNGVPQAIDLVNLGDVPVSLVLGLDLSESVAGAKLEALRRGCDALLGAVQPEDTATLLTFGTTVTERVPATQRLDLVTRAVHDARTGGDTALVDATLAAMLRADTDAGRTLVVVFSDGVDTASFTRPEVAIETARRINGVVYGVWSGGERPALLTELAGATGGRVLDITETADPGPAFVEILGEFRRRYVITFTPTAVAGSGWHRLDVRVARRGARVQSRSGYFAAQQK
jgi:VWFA-related protein